MHVVFVSAEEYGCATFESEKIFGISLFKWLANAKGMFSSANSVATFTSARVTFKGNNCSDKVYEFYVKRMLGFKGKNTFCFYLDSNHLIIKKYDHEHTQHALLC